MNETSNRPETLLTSSDQPEEEVPKLSTNGGALMVAAFTLLLYLSVFAILVKHRRETPFDSGFYRICRWLAVSDCVTLVSTHIRAFFLRALRAQTQLLTWNTTLSFERQLRQGMLSESGGLIRTLHCVQATMGVLGMYCMMHSALCIAVLLHSRRIALNPYNLIPSYDREGRLLLCFTGGSLLLTSPAFLLILSMWIFRGQPQRFAYLHIKMLKAVACIGLSFLVVFLPLIVALTITTAFAATKLVKVRQTEQRVNNTLKKAITYTVGTSGGIQMGKLPDVIQVNKQKEVRRQQRLLSGIRRSAVYAVLLALPVTVFCCAVLQKLLRLHLADWPKQTHLDYWTGPALQRHLIEVSSIEKLAKNHTTGSWNYLMYAWYVGQNPYVFLLSSSSVRHYLWLYMKRSISSVLVCVPTVKTNQILPANPQQGPPKQSPHERIHCLSGTANLQSQARKQSPHQRTHNRVEPAPNQWQQQILQQVKHQQVNNQIAAANLHPQPPQQSQHQHVPNRFEAQKQQKQMPHQLKLLQKRVTLASFYPEPRHNSKLCPIQSRPPTVLSSSNSSLFTIVSQPSQGTSYWSNTDVCTSVPKPLTMVLDTTKITCDDY